MTKTLTILLLLFGANNVLGTPADHSPCQPHVQGDFYIGVHDLYPESTAWDPVTCRLYLSSTYNLSLAIYDPSTNSSEVVPIPGLTNHGNFNYTAYHLNGVDYDPYTGHIWVAAGSADAFTAAASGNYSNANFTGPNRILEFNPKSKTFVKDIDLSKVQQQYFNKIGNYTSGFQDMAETPAGDTYAIGTFGNSIVKISQRTGIPELWYVPAEYDKTYGFGGIIAIKEKLVISDTISGGLVTFDTRKGPIPTFVSLSGLPSDYRPLSADGLYAPPMYGGKVVLWSDDYNGTSIYGSNDDWKTAHYLGLVLNDASAKAEGGLAVATVQIGKRIFSLNEFFQFTLPVKSRPSFPIFDITHQVKGALASSWFQLK